MRRSADGDPDPSNASAIRADATAGPVQLIAGPGGDIFYPWLERRQLRRLTLRRATAPPTRSSNANPASGDRPRYVVSSLAPARAILSLQPRRYAWDLDGDGAFDDSPALSPQFTYHHARGSRDRAAARDRQAGLSDVRRAARIRVQHRATDASSHAARVDSTWTGRRRDHVLGSVRRDRRADGPAARVGACAGTSSCTTARRTAHTSTPCQRFAGSASGSFPAPDHEYPSHLELRLTATDGGGLQGTASVLLTRRR